MKKIIIIFLLAVLNLSCSDGLYNELNRPSADPEISEPTVISFSEESTIFVEWDDDILADEYILYRALDGSVLNFQEIYRGIECQYRDTNGNDDYIYHYSLAKVRGLRFFDMSSSAMGVVSVTTDDFYEDNNSKEKASILNQGILITANLYGYQDSFGNYLTDEDWYRISVPAGCTANVIVRQLYPLASDGADNHFKSYQEGQPSVPVVDGRDINIINGSNVNENYYLEIFPNPTKYFPNPDPGGTIVSYQIFIDRVY